MRNNVCGVAFTNICSEKQIISKICAICKIEVFAVPQPGSILKFWHFSASRFYKNGFL